MAPVGREVLRLLRTMSAWLLVCAALDTAARAQSPAPPGPRPVGLPEIAEPVAPVAPQVVDIQVEGNRKHTREAVLNAMTTRIGHPFDQAAFEKDIRKLTSRSWFVHVVPKKDLVPAGVIITLSVVERPVLQYVRYFGVEQVGMRAIEKETGLKKNDAFDPYAVREAARKIEALYQSKGFNDVSVDIAEGIQPGDQGAVFLINEGKKLKFGQISFEGNSRDIAPDGRLKKIVQSRKPIFGFFKGEVDHQKLEEDIERLLEYYRGLGFFKATVGRKVSYNRDEDRLYVTFHIFEGPRYDVRNITFMGNRIFPSEALGPTLSLESGQPYDQAVLNKDIGTIKDLYGSNGYVFADAVADLRFDLEPGVVDIIYKVEEGQQYRIGDIRVTIKGDNPHTRHSTILNRLDMYPGDIADIRKFRDSERRIQASGLFNVDPSKGELPRITFSPPEEFENIVSGQNKSRAATRRTGSTDSFRGQSPDNAADTWSQPPSAPPAAAQASSAEPQWFNGQPVLAPAARPAASNPGFAPPAQQPSGAPAQRPGYLPNRAPNQFLQETPSRQVVRGQSPDRYSGYGGSAVNPISPSPQPYAQPAVQAYGQQPAAQPIAQAGAAPAAASPYATPAQYAAPAQDPLSGLSQPRDFGGPPVIAPPPGDFLGGPEQLPPSQPMLPIDVIASEAQTGRFMLGAGVNSNAGVVGSIILDEQNFDWRRFPTSWEDFRSGRAFRGAGQKFRIEAAPGTEVQRYLFNFSDPFIFDTRVSFGLSGYYFNRYYRDWMEQRLGGRVSFGYQFTPDFSGNIGFRAEDVYIAPSTPDIPDLELVQGHTQLYSIRTGLAHDTRDSTFLPTEGHFITGTFEWFTGSFDYPWFGLNSQKHWLLRERPDRTGRHTFSYYNQLGFAGSNTPVYERFFAGGFSTLRGFQFRGASPRQESVPAGNSAIVGGNFQWLNSLEYMFPITADDMLKGVVFVDFGTVEESVSDVNWSDYRIAPGMGIRVTIPAISAAPIAIDIAGPIQRADGDLIQNVSFFVGVGR